MYIPLGRNFMTATIHGDRARDQTGSGTAVIYPEVVTLVASVDATGHV